MVEQACGTFVGVEAKALLANEKALDNLQERLGLFDLRVVSGSRNDGVGHVVDRVDDVLRGCDTPSVVLT